MESLAREKRYGSGSKRPSATQSTASSAPATADDGRSPNKKLKLTRREKKKQKARSIERDLGVSPGETYEPPSSQKRMKLEPTMYRALLEAASPRRRKNAAAAAASTGCSQGSQQQQQGARKATPMFRKIQHPLPPPPFYPSPTRSSHPTQDELRLSPVQHSQAADQDATLGRPRPTGGPNDRDATPLFLPEFDDELAGRIIARGEARKRAAANVAQRGTPPARGRAMAAADSASADGSSDDDDLGDNYDRERFPDHASETPELGNAEAGPSSTTSYVYVYETDDDDIGDTDGGDDDDNDPRLGSGSHSTNSPNAPGTSERSLGSLDLLAVPTNVPGAVPASVQAAQAAAAAATAALTSQCGRVSSSKGKGKKRAAPPTDGESDPSAPPRKITRKRESYQAKTTAMWMREQCLTAAEADERWERYLVGRGGHKGETFKLAMKQRESVLVSRWMLDDEIGFNEAGRRMRALTDREEREKAARQKAARVSAAAHGELLVVGTPSSPAKRGRTSTRKGRTSAAATAAATVATVAIPKPPRSPSIKASTSAVVPAAVTATTGRRKGPISTTARAVELLCSTESGMSGGRDASRLLTIIDLFSASGNSAEVYLSLPDTALRAAWVERRLKEKGGA